jgi:hypothetical protein
LKLKPVEVLMRYTQTPLPNAQYRERDVDMSDPASERTSSDRVRWVRPATTHRSDFKSHPVTSDRRSTARRIVRAAARFLLAVLIGIGATLGWQFYGDQAMEMVRAWDPSLDRLLPASVAKPVAPVTSAEVQQQLKPMAIDIALLRRSVERFAANLDQLARKDEQIAQAIAALQAAEQDISQKISAPPLPREVHRRSHVESVLIARNL